MSGPEDPVVDDRTREELYEELLSVADTYTDQWDADSGDSAAALLRIFTRMEHDVVQRVNSVPGKHRIAFLDELGFTRRPPQAARLPLTFRVSEGLDENVAIPGGTQATASTGDGGESVIFEIPQDGGFEATEADAVELYAVDPEHDRVLDHGDCVREGEAATLFEGEDLQEHVLYLGHEGALNLEGGASITVTLSTNATDRVIDEATRWEYYGQAPSGADGEGGDGEDGEDAGDGEEETPDWYPLPRQAEGEDAIDPEEATVEELRAAIRESGGDGSDRDNSEWGDNEIPLEFELPAGTVETEVDGTESRWLRCRLVGDDPRAFDVEVTSVRVGVEGEEGPGGGSRPGSVLSNDVPLSLDEDELYPFGRRPQAPTTLYVASEEAFSKRGGHAELQFRPPKSDQEEDLARPDDPVDDDGDAGTGDDGDDGADGDDGDDGADGDDGPGFGGPLGGPPEVSWEYWDGDGWSRLPLAYDDTATLRRPGSIGFTVPEDLAPTSVSGHEANWIRARLVSGNYGQPRYEVDEDGGPGELVDEPDPPRYGDIRVSYGQDGEPFEEMLTYNNVAYETVERDRDRRGDGAEGEGPVPFEPFEALPDERQSLYVGFDGALHNGPIKLHVPMEDRTYPQTFDPGIEWEHCESPDRWQWSKLDFRDGTAGLTERGIVSLNVPDPTDPFELFGVERHWLRVRVTEDAFVGEFGADEDADRSPGSDAGPDAGARAAPGDGEELLAGPGGDGAPGPGPGAGVGRARGSGNGTGAGTVEPDDGSTPTIRDGGIPKRRRARGGPSARTGPGNGEAAAGTRRPPTVEGIHTNTQWAFNVRTVEDEILGSSDGSHDQSFYCEEVPVTEAEVWVDEESALSGREKRQLEAERPDDVEDVVTGGEEPGPFWVRWTEVEDFLDSGDADRHYRIDRATGHVAFGDGRHGAIPPSGEDNLRITYKTGGGSDGNLPAGAIDDLRTSISLVESVTNLRASDGGADVESTEAVVSRGPERIKNRGRAVSASDFEEVARAGSRELAKVKCEPEMDGAGNDRPGFVTLLIVPQERRDRPSPSMELKQRVREEVGDRAPATLVGDDRQRITVRGPDYTPVSVDVTVRIRGGQSITQLKGRIERDFDEFLHPLSGGDGEGWAFTECPRLTRISSLVGEVDGVEAVESLGMSFETPTGEVTVADGESSPDLPRGSLVCSGSHDVTVIMGDGSATHR